MRRMIEQALTKHETVRVISEIGNHDDHTSIMLATCLAQFYEREPRVEVDDSPKNLHWYRFGRNLVVTTHTDKLKGERLYQVIAHDLAKEWGETKFRYCYGGHVHHDSEKEMAGLTVMTMRTLAPQDDWHTKQGYRAGQDMKCDVLHREFGRIERHIVGIEQISEAA